MEPMKPMQPMKPMEPMHAPEPWWPDGLGQPSSSGGQNDWKYAVFADQHRLVIARGDALKVYDSADHQISGVSQSQGGLLFHSQNGDVALDRLKVVG